jgi:Sap, sulfolipid-1-addressing protein
VSWEAIALAVASAARPTGLAAVYALLSAARPRRLLTAYVVAGFAWSATVGIVVVGALHGVNVATGTSTANAVIDLLGGGAALGLAAAMATGRLQTESDPHSPSQDSTMVRRLRDPSLTLAAGVGVATHLPGLFYLLGLNAIAATDPGFAAGAIDALIFNAIWFSTPVGSLVLSVRRPSDTRRALARLNAWVRRYERAAVAIFLAGVGAYFATKGAVNLLG